jgi:hypothetical protein
MGKYPLSLISSTAVRRFFLGLDFISWEHRLLLSPCVVSLQRPDSSLPPPARQSSLPRSAEQLLPTAPTSLRAPPHLPSARQLNPQRCGFHPSACCACVPLPLRSELHLRASSTAPWCRARASLDPARLPGRSSSAAPSLLCSSCASSPSLAETPSRSSTASCPSSLPLPSSPSVLLVGASCSVPPASRALFFCPLRPACRARPAHFHGARPPSCCSPLAERSSSSSLSARPWLPCRGPFPASFFLRSLQLEFPLPSRIPLRRGPARPRVLGFQLAVEALLPRLLPRTACSLVRALLPRRARPCASRSRAALPARRCSQLALRSGAALRTAAFHLPAQLNALNCPAPRALAPDASRAIFGSRRSAPSSLFPSGRNKILSHRVIGHCSQLTMEFASSPYI